MTVEIRPGEPVLPGMPEPEPLWAVHIEGPDDIIAEASRESAEKRAGWVNDWYQARTQQEDYDPATFPRMHARVIPWPFLREAHAEDLRQQREEYGGA